MKGIFIVKFIIYSDVLIKNLRKIWDHFDGDHSGIMEYNEFIEFIKELNIKIEGLSSEELFQKIDTDNSGKIDFEEFATYYKELTGGKEFKGIFDQYSRDKVYLSLDEFYQFMIDIQKAPDFTMIDALELFTEFCVDMDKDVRSYLKEKLVNREILEMGIE